MMSKAERKKLVIRLIGLEFEPAPGHADFTSGMVSAGWPDGVYFNLTDERQIELGNKPRDVQLIVVGRMRLAPIEYGEKIGDYWVLETQMIDGDHLMHRGLLQIIRERGFTSIILRSNADELRPEISADYVVKDGAAKAA